MLGCLIYLTASITNRFVGSMPDNIAIPMDILGMVYIILGLVFKKHSRRSKTA